MLKIVTNNTQIKVLAVLIAVVLWALVRFPLR
jgi:hypothetical protein